MITDTIVTIKNTISNNEIMNRFHGLPLLATPLETMQHIAFRTKEKRLELNWSQQTLSTRSSVSLSVIKKFERTGKISLEALLKLAWRMGCLPDFFSLFKPASPESFLTLKQVIREKKTRKRGRT